MRMTILAMPPVIPLIHDELQMSETQVGLLIGLPLAIFAIAAVPGSLLIARIGTSACGDPRHGDHGARGRGARAPRSMSGRSTPPPSRPASASPSCSRRLPTLVREWVPGRMALGTVVYTSGMLIGATFRAGADHSVCAAPGGRQLAARSRRLGRACAADRPGVLPARPAHARPWPDRHRDRRALVAGLESPLIWLLGLTFGSNNSTYFATNAFLGDYLASHGGPSCSGLRWAGSTAHRFRPSSSCSG